MMKEKNLLKTLLLVLFICLFSVTNMYAGVAEDIISHHKLDMNKEKDRRKLMWIVHHDYSHLESKMNLKWYFLVYASHNNRSEKNDFSVVSREEGNYATYLNEELFFFIVKLENGMTIANSSGLDGYYVPIDYITTGAVSYKKSIKLRNNVWLMMDNKPEKVNHYYRIRDGLVYQGESNQYFKQLGGSKNE